MHTLKVIAAGFVLLGVFLFAGRYFAGSRPGAMAAAAKFFIPVWFVGAAINLWFGVSHAGYSGRDEAPIFLLIFARPSCRRDSSLVARVEPLDNLRRTSPSL